MKLKSVAASVAVAALLGLGVATAEPAAAATGAWKPYGNTNPITSSPYNWACGATKTINTNVFAQACAVRTADTAGTSVRTAVIVRNNQAGLYGAEVAAVLKNGDGETLGRWTCPRSGVGANSWSVCFGAWVTSPYPSWVWTTGPAAVNGTQLADSAPI
jgi:hypothetical protein